MNTKTTQIALLLGLGCFLSSMTGCATARLPWFAKTGDTSSMDGYVAQAASEIQYNTDVDFDRDYQPSPQPGPSYTSPPARTASQSSGGSGESCSSGCCH